MSLGAKFLARRKKSSDTAIKSQITLGHMGNGIRPILEMVKLIKPNDEVTIDFDWHNIKDDICHIRKEAVRTK